MTSRLTELGTAIHFFANEDEAYDALSLVHGDPALVERDPLPRSGETDTAPSGRVLPLRSSPTIAPGAAENFNPPEAA